MSTQRKPGRPIKQQEDVNLDITSPSDILTSITTNDSQIFKSIGKISLLNNPTSIYFSFSPEHMLIYSKGNTTNNEILLKVPSNNFRLYKYNELSTTILCSSKIIAKIFNVTKDWELTFISDSSNNFWLERTNSTSGNSLYLVNKVTVYDSIPSDLTQSDIHAEFNIPSLTFKRQILSNVKVNTQIFVVYNSKEIKFITQTSNIGGKSICKYSAPMYIIKHIIEEQTLKLNATDVLLLRYLQNKAELCFYFTKSSTILVRCKIDGSKNVSFKILLNKNEELSRQH